MSGIDQARDAARSWLAESLPRRWRHVQGVAARADAFSWHLERESGEQLRMAAWLHDIGYAPDLAVTGFHPLDGARHLHRLGWPQRVCNLVAFHSAASAEATVFGVADRLTEFTDEASTVRDLLWYADMTTGPDGQPMTFTDRMNEVRARYGPAHYVVRALDAGMAQREAAVTRVQEWLEAVSRDAPTGT